MFDGGAWMPDPEPHNHTATFYANSEHEAWKTAWNEVRATEKQYFGAQSTIDDLVKIEDVQLKDKKDDRQLELPFI